ncbi:MAG: DUF4920 domain-containing protein [Chitinophagales bacterium]|nr:DUF4920 domain-containing protein [Bacteroidota bacterium]
MKFIFSSIVFCLFLTACTSSSQQFGEQFKEQNPISIDEALNQLQTNPIISNVQISGKVEKSCMSEGCWFTIKNKDGNEIYLDVKDKKFRLPTNSAGKTVVLLADVQKDTSSEQGVAVLVKGLMFKKALTH